VSSPGEDDYLDGEGIIANDDATPVMGYSGSKLKRQSDQRGG
jgi:hypothetical protein